MLETSSVMKLTRGSSLWISALLHSGSSLENWSQVIIWNPVSMLTMEWLNRVSEEARGG